jgi:hypothetical protein
MHICKSISAELGDAQCRGHKTNSSTRRLLIQTIIQSISSSIRRNTLDIIQRKQISDKAIHNPMKIIL